MPKRADYEIVGDHHSSTRSLDGIELDTDPDPSFPPPSTIISRARRWVGVAATLLVASGAFLASSQRYHPLYSSSSGSCPAVIWSDEFSGSELDLTKWSFQNGDGCDVGLCGWGNNELEFYTPDNLRIDHGMLTIEARYDPYADPPHQHQYTSSKILSKGKADFGVSPPFGGASGGGGSRFEASIKLPVGKGMWPAFWMLPTQNVLGGWPKSGEIDIMENIGKEGPNTVHATIHYGDDWPNDQYNEAGITLDVPPNNNDLAVSNSNSSSGFHVYSVEREVGKLRFYVDNIMYSTLAVDDVKPFPWPFDREFYFILNLAVGGNWPGPPDNTTIFPQQLQVDYVRVWDSTFPRIDGMLQVESGATNVTYRVVNNNSNEEDDSSYTWSVPAGAILEGGQGTQQIRVTVGTQGGVVRVKREGGISTTKCSSSSSNNNPPLPQTSGLYVKVLDASQYTNYKFNCGRPKSCTGHVLNRIADNYSCGDRIEWLMENNDGDKGEETTMTEDEACEKVAREQNGICGGCFPLPGGRRRR